MVHFAAEQTAVAGRRATEQQSEGGRVTITRPPCNGQFKAQPKASPRPRDVRANAAGKECRVPRARQFPRSAPRALSAPGHSPPERQDAGPHPAPAAGAVPRRQQRMALFLFHPSGQRALLQSSPQPFPRAAAAEPRSADATCAELPSRQTGHPKTFHSIDLKVH